MDDTAKEILTSYQRGRNSIQDLARIYRVSVPEVLNIIGEGKLASVDMPGDLIDPSDAGQGATMNYGQTIDVPFTVD